MKPRKREAQGQLLLLDITPTAAPVSSPAPAPRPARGRQGRVAGIPTSSTAQPARVAPPRPHGPVKARCPSGELQAVPDVPRQVTRIALTVEQLPSGRLRFSQPRLGGWAMVAASVQELGIVVRSAFREAQIGAYSDWRHHAYDEPDAPKHRRQTLTARSARRCDVYDCRLWKLDPDREGVWISPKGLRFPEERQVVQRVIAARRALGLSPRPDPVQPDLQESA